MLNMILGHNIVKKKRKEEYYYKYKYKNII